MNRKDDFFMKLITKSEFIKKYVPEKTKAKEQAFQRLQSDCIQMGYTDVFLKPYVNQTYIVEERYQDFLINKAEQEYGRKVKAAKNAARF